MASAKIFNVPARWAANEKLGDLETTFTGDFNIAEDISGAAGIKETFARAWESWRSDIHYVANLAYALNHKSWERFDAGDQELCELYVDLYNKVCEAVWDDDSAYTDEERRIFFHLTD